MASPWSVEVSPWAVLDALDALERKNGANDRGKQHKHVWTRRKKKNCCALFSRMRCPLASSPARVALFSRCPLLQCTKTLIVRRRAWSGSHRPCLLTGREGGQEDPARRQEEKEDPAHSLFCSSFLGMLLSSAPLVNCSDAALYAPLLTSGVIRE
jgi:hypothetical protein